ncbi:MAG: type II toxin-antitoxin system RelE family toxin [Thermoproteota archaeon]
MPYKAALTKSFLRELKKLPEDVRTRVLRAADEFSQILFQV